MSSGTRPFIVKMIRDVPAGTPIIPFRDEEIALAVLAEGDDLSRYTFERVPETDSIEVATGACIVRRQDLLPGVES